MSRSKIDKSKLLETALSTLTMIATILVTTPRTKPEPKDNTNKSQEFTNAYLMYSMPVLTPEAAKNRAILAAKIQEADRETDEYWKTSRVRDIAAFASDKDDTTKTYAIGEISRIASTCKDSFWRKRILDEIDELA